MNQNVIVYGLNFFDKIFNFEYEQCYDWDKFANSKLFRILIIREDIFHSQIDKNINEKTKKYLELTDSCDLLLLWNEELHWYQFNNQNENNLYGEILKHQNIFSINGGIINDDFYASKAKTNLSWFRQCVDIYKDLENKLNELKPYENKQFTFDALLGSQRLHRDFVYKKICENNLKQNIITSYLNDITSDNWFRDDDVDYSHYIDNKNAHSKLMSSNPIIYYGKPIWIAHVIPFGVYNKSAYTIITETGYKNGITFPTEKTAKPILSKRLFVMFSGQYFLKNLKELGFKTFDNIIDESYDLEENNDLRFQKAWNCVEQLLILPQEEVLEIVKPIVEHNFNHLMNFPFDDFVKKQCTEILVNRYYESQRIYT